ncbi:DUF1295 domain-containing protein [Streptococcus parauberis]|uniref:DUF1295 domain-containing protein n=1 Tax=Streptococcus parauberis TaxID=1348 RepID=UPI000C14F720|nr:DUF1295 domain-containing protein [Streptococcus parauberis]PIA86857.1 3-oxo-5-alpha-steroid 4-dehydrogenase [Streptococcus parauberis]
MNKYILTVGIVLISFIFVFFIGKRENKHDLLDVLWGAAFILSSVISYLISNNKTYSGLLMTILVIIWGSRLTFHLAKRNIKAKEDFRYDDYRKNYKGKYFDFYFFFRMYLVQFVLCIIVVLPVIYVNITGNAKISILTINGIFLWIIGFIFESVGDKQLKDFRSKSENKGELMTSGLWAYTRHPNYFGEAIQWWGIYIISISNLNNVWLIFSPLVITLLVRFVSGVPLLERKYEGRQDWEEYKNSTSVFFPLPQKSKN